MNEICPSVVLPSSDWFARSSKTFNFESFRKDLADELSRKTSPGSFACWANNLPSINPGLSVHGLGPIGLPVHEAEAQRVIKSAKKAPYGKGGETIVDEDVRKTWEIDASEIVIENPKWAQWISNILEMVKRDLGLKTEVIHAELYKLLIYGQDAHFKPHRDTEKAPGMFGTLVVCLPSRHEGGDIRVLHGEEEKVFSTSINSAFEMSCAAWYSDVLHEVRPVTTGYRVVLTYNLIMDDASFKPSADAVGDNTILSRLISRYTAAVGCDANLPSELIYRLGHKYTRASLGVESLKRSDRTALKRLSASAHESCEIYLGLLEREVYGGCDEGSICSYGYEGEWSENEDDEDDEDSKEDYENENCSKTSGPDHEIIDVCSESTDLKHIVTPGGELIADKLPASEKSFIQDIYKSSRCPDKEDFSGFTGNEGVSATHWYRDAVLVLVPKKLSHTFKLGPCLENQKLLPAILDSVLQRIDNGDLGARDELSDICQICMGKEEQTRKAAAQSSYKYDFEEKLLKCEIIAKLAIACEATQNTELFCRATALFDSNMPISCFKSIGRHFQFTDPQRAKCFDGIKAAVLKLQKPAQILAAFDRLKDGYYATHSDSDTSFSDFVAGSMDAVVDAFENKLNMELLGQSSLHEDGLALITVLSKYNRKDLESKVLNQARHVSSTTGAAIGLLLGLLKAYNKNEVFDAEKFKIIFSPLYDNLIRQFDLKSAVQTVPSFPHWLVSDYYKDRRKNYRGRDDIIESNQTLGRQTARLYGQCLRAEDVPEDRLLDAVLTSLELEWTKENFESFTIPFLQTLIDVLEENSLKCDSHSGRYQHFFQRVIELYLRNHVGQKPTPPQDWSRKKVGCCCDDCETLNRFLENGKEKTMSFSMGKKRRQHFERELAKVDEKHDERTEYGKSSHILVITKNSKKHRQNLNEWHGRVTQAENNLGCMKLNVLESLIGTQYFEGKKLHFAELPMLQSHSSRTPLADKDANTQAAKRQLEGGSKSLAFKKRKGVEATEIINLT